jgi:hypothetical protein
MKVIFQFDRVLSSEQTCLIPKEAVCHLVWTMESRGMPSSSAIDGPATYPIKHIGPWLILADLEHHTCKRSSVERDA